ncbi:MAG: hypothetical protein M3N98_12435 [Actinomycetota bacterium]|nr:hypothetical protein [Actinomycetota bacterium]
MTKTGGGSGMVGATVPGGVVGAVAGLATVAPVALGGLAMTVGLTRFGADAVAATAGRGDGTTTDVGAAGAGTARADCGAVTGGPFGFCAPMSPKFAAAATPAVQVMATADTTKATAFLIGTVAPLRADTQFLLRWLCTLSVPGGTTL